MALHDPVKAASVAGTLMSRYGIVLWQLIYKCSGEKAIPPMPKQTTKTNHAKTILPTHGPDFFLDYF
jgi:hypothetical protein